MNFSLHLGIWLWKIARAKTNDILLALFYVQDDYYSVFGFYAIFDWAEFLMKEKFKLKYLY